jgi:hypothetical protein
VAPPVKKVSKPEEKVQASPNLPLKKGRPPGKQTTLTQVMLGHKTAAVTKKITP